VDCICFKAKYFADFGIWWHSDIIEEARYPDLAADMCQDKCRPLLVVVHVHNYKSHTPVSLKIPYHLSVFRHRFACLTLFGAVILRDRIYAT
jgi:hypothetical protein